MKITPEHAAQIAEFFHKGAALIPPVAEYEQAGMTKRRHAWDALHAAKFHASDTMREVYRYANDNHIDTVLRSLTP